MAVFQCKMCGGDLHLTEGSTIAQCEYCGVRQTVPLLDDDKKESLFTRANQLRAECDFEKASVVYESIVRDFPREPEAYWGLLLCEYGIEYVNDPHTGKKVPTCHRAAYQSLLEEGDYKRVLEYADPKAAELYREEAERIEKIRKEILALATQEEAYDIFICYKETDAAGRRTIDSVMAQDLYIQLTNAGYRVFFSRITLEQKLGCQYEPYIFAALNSAKVMLVVGTEPSHFQSVWVKNEWSRYLKLMASDRSKHLIPCYKNMDPHEMPAEFAVLQAQDLGKIGAVQDILWGIGKLISKKEEAPVQQQKQPQSPVHKHRPRISAVIWAVLLSFVAIAMVGSTDPSLEERPKLFVQESIINIILLQLIIPVKMLVAALILRKKCTQGDARAICISTITLCVMMGIMTTSRLEDLVAHMTGSEVSGLLFGMIGAAAQIILYKLSKIMFYRICNFPIPSKK